MISFLGHYNENGLFYIFDRLKEVIKVGSYQVSPSELESVLLTHPTVADAAVVGIEDHKMGEVPLGFVVRRGDIMEKEIRDFVSGQVRIITSYSARLLLMMQLVLKHFSLFQFG